MSEKNFFGGREHTEDIVLYLPSDVRSSYMENRTSHFITEIHPALELSNNADVRLLECIVPRMFENITAGNNEVIVSNMYDGEEERNVYKIKQGYYETVSELLNQISQYLPQSITIVRDKLNDKIRIKLTEEAITHKTILKLSPYLAAILGFITRTEFTNDGSILMEKNVKTRGQIRIYRGDVLPDLRFSTYCFYIYLDIVKQSRVGDSFSNILSIIPTYDSSIDPVNHPYMHKILERPQPVQINRRYIKLIEIKICDSLGEIIHFNG